MQTSLLVLSFELPLRRWYCEHAAEFIKDSETMRRIHGNVRLEIMPYFTNPLVTIERANDLVESKQISSVVVRMPEHPELAEDNVSLARDLAAMEGLQCKGAMVQTYCPITCKLADATFESERAESKPAPLEFDLEQVLKTGRYVPEGPKRIMVAQLDSEPLNSYRLSPCAQDYYRRLACKAFGCTDPKLFFTGGNGHGHQPVADIAQNARVWGIDGILIPLPPVPDTFSAYNRAWTLANELFSEDRNPITVLVHDFERGESVECTPLSRIPFRE